MTRTTAPSRMNGINITPLIDILLVLLVIFLAALPLTQKGLDATLPSTIRTPQAPSAIMLTPAERSA